MCSITLVVKASYNKQNDEAFLTDSLISEPHTDSIIYFPLYLSLELLK